MSKKKSSFQMGNQFNGYGDTVYLKADTVKLPPISQDNVQPTPDYSRYALHAVDGGPAVLNPEAASQDISKMRGSVPSVNRAALSENKADGSYTVGFIVTSSGGFYDNPYPTNKGNGSRAAVPGELDYFAVTKNNNLIIREGRSAQSTELGDIGIGKTFKVITENGHIVQGRDDDENKDIIWVKASYDGAVGWVSKEFIRPDVTNRIQFLHDYYNYDNVKVTMSYKNNEEIDEDKRNKTITISKYPRIKWHMESGGTDQLYPLNCLKVNDKWTVAVGPCVIDPLYDINGRLEADDMKPFSKLIKVHLLLRNKKDTAKTKGKTMELYVSDLKAHTFNQYPYPTSVNKRTDLGSSHHTSDFVYSADVAAECGMIQTGIRFPNAENESVVSIANVDASIIEFCGKNLPGLDFNLDDYELDYIETNYEKSTRGEAAKKPWIK